MPTSTTDPTDSASSAAPTPAPARSTARPPGSSGKLLAEQGIELVYGGASVGIMGELADAVHEDGGHVTGIIPQQLIQKEAAHTGIPDLIVVASMHQRKSQMADLSRRLHRAARRDRDDGGVLRDRHLGPARHPRQAVGLLNVAGYFDGLIAFLDHAVTEGFLTEEHRPSHHGRDGSRRLLERMRSFEADGAVPLMGRANR